MTRQVCLVEDAVERFVPEERITRTFGRYPGLPRTLAGSVRAEASQQSWVLSAPGPYPLSAFRYHRPHGER